MEEGFAGFCILWVLGVVGFSKGFYAVRSEAREQDVPWPYEIEDEAYKVEEQEEDFIVETKKSDWDKICEKAIEKAVEGDASARAWVTKNVYDSETKEDLLTDSAIVEDAVLALKSVGYTIGDARKVAESLAKNKKYDSLDSLLKDAIKG